ncbi:MAG TPA: hypothetical protein PKH07_07005, partial [bacterium]|nr:hypothetical protein [bacterium]
MSKQELFGARNQRLWLLFGISVVLSGLCCVPWLAFCQTIIVDDLHSAFEATEGWQQGDVLVRRHSTT